MLELIWLMGHLLSPFHHTCKLTLRGQTHSLTLNININKVLEVVKVNAYLNKSIVYQKDFLSNQNIDKNPIER
jgi:hypothetical protein